jgi:hypothetical protein
VNLERVLLEDFHEQAEGADLDDVSPGERVCFIKGYDAAIERRRVRARKVDDVETPGDFVNAGVKPRHGRVINHDVAIGHATDSQALRDKGLRILRAILTRDDERAFS